MRGSPCPPAAKSTKWWGGEMGSAQDSSGLCLVSRTKGLELRGRLLGRGVQPLGPMSHMSGMEPICNQIRPGGS